MTNAELIAKIKAEINKKYAEYREKMKTDDFTYYEGMADALDLFEQFIDTLKSEKPMKEGLEEEIREYMSNDDNNPYDWDWRDKRDCARHFAQWGAEHLANSNDEVVINGHKVEYNKDTDAITMEAIPNDLEEATSKCNGCNNVKGCVTCVNGDQWAHYEESEKPVPNDLQEYASRAGFDYVDDIEVEVPGHRWNDHDVEYAYRDGIIAGAKWDREQMLKEAVVVEVGMHGEPIDITLDKYVQRAMGIFPGDKVRVIVLPKEDEK